ncbi:MAG: hypothetical protein AAFZ65_02030 [Planctomycetota bacterium]
MIAFVSVAAAMAGMTAATDSAAPQSPNAISQDVEQRLLSLEERNDELERRLELLSEELEQTALGDAYVPVGESFRGLSPAASKIYQATSPLSIGGYGEAIYNNFQGTEIDEADFLRAILYIGYRINEKWLINTEFEFEHAGTSGGGSASLEFGYLEYFATDNLSFRFGLLLIPIGWVNELHEPQLFPSADRPFLETQIIPSTFRENGLGFAGENEHLAYRGYVVNGLDASGFTDENLRSGRQQGSEALADDLAIVGRLDYIGVDGLIVGVSAFHGNSGQGSDAGSVTTTILDSHIEYQTRGWRFRWLGVWAEIDDVAELNAANGLDPIANPGDAFESVGEELSGFYLEGMYNVFNETDETSELLPFIRYEQFDTQAEVPDGFVSDPANDQEIWTYGIAYKPHPNVVFKADYVDRDNDAGTAVDIMRFSMGYVF